MRFRALAGVPVSDRNLDTSVAGFGLQRFLYEGCEAQSGRWMMAFSLSSASIDLVGKSATIVASETNIVGAGDYVLRIQFPFEARNNQDDLSTAIAEAKAALQKAINELKPPARP
jgi:hypothetical protein